MLKIRIQDKKGYSQRTPYKHFKKSVGGCIHWSIFWVLYTRFLSNCTVNTGWNGSFDNGYFFAKYEFVNQNGWIIFNTLDAELLLLKSSKIAFRYEPNPLLRVVSTLEESCQWIVIAHCVIYILIRYWKKLKLI